MDSFVNEFKHLDQILKNKSPPAKRSLANLTPFPSRRERSSIRPSSHPSATERRSSLCDRKEKEEDEVWDFGKVREVADFVEENRKLDKLELSC